MNIKNIGLCKECMKKLKDNFAGSMVYVRRTNVVDLAKLKRMRKMGMNAAEIGRAVNLTERRIFQLFAKHKKQLS